MSPDIKFMYFQTQKHTLFESTINRAGTDVIKFVFMKPVLHATK